MLCAPDSSLCAQDAQHSLPSHPTAQVSLIHDPYDPRIDTEYEMLVHRWTDQLLQRSREFTSFLEDPISTTTIDDTKVSFPDSRYPSATVEGITIINENQQWLADMNRFFEELWLDSQRMLQCAHAWNYSSSLPSLSSNTDALTVNEAVQSMNIFGLRVMQRTLYARQTLLKRHFRQQPSLSATAAATASPLLTPSKSTSEAAEAVTSAATTTTGAGAGTRRCVRENFEEDDNDNYEKSPTNTKHHTSLNLSVAEEDEEGHEMNAPLLRRTYHQSLTKSCNCTTSSCRCDNPNRRSANHVSRETMTTSSWVGLLPYPPVRRPASCFPTTTTSTSATNSGGGPSSVAARRRRHQLALSTATPPHLPRRSTSTRGTVSSRRGHYQRQHSDALSMASSSGLSNMDEDGLWKSWFGNNDGMDNNNDQHPLCTSTTSKSASSCDYDCSTHVPKKCMSTDNAEDLVVADQHVPSDDDDAVATTGGRRATTIVPYLPMDEKAQIDWPIDEPPRHCLHLSSSNSSTKDLAVITPPMDPSPLKMMHGYGFTSAMARCESSISTFRPISKDLPLPCPKDLTLAEHGSPSSSSSVPQPHPITKSKSFPSKSASMSCFFPSKESLSSATLVPVPSKTLPHPITHDSKERNFVMRSIVRKKASLGKLFSAKK